MTPANHELTASVGPGPFYKFSIIRDGALENTVEPGSPGAVTIEGRVLDGKDSPVVAPDALIEIYSGDQFARSMADDTGHFQFVVRKPQPPPPPLDDGRAQAPHFRLIMWVFPMAEPHQTRIYFPDEQPANENDPFLSRLDEHDRQTLVPHPDGDVLHWDIRLSGDQQTAFFVPESGPSLIDAGIAYRPYEQPAHA